MQCCRPLSIPCQDQEQECPVCLEVLASRDPTELPCKHLICSDCLKGLHRHGVNQTCPLCRAKLPSGCENLFAEAVTLFQRADTRGYSHRHTTYVELVTLCRRILELEPSHGRATGLLGHCYHLGKGVKKCHSTALGLLETALELEIDEAAVGGHRVYIAAALTNLAYMHNDMGNPKAALPMYTRAHEITEAELGPHHPDTASTLNNLASLHKEMGNHKASLSLYMRLIEIDEAELRPHPTKTAIILSNLAALHFNMGNPKAALPLHRKALEIREAVLGSRHLTILYNVLVLCVLSDF